VPFRVSRASVPALLFATLLAACGGDSTSPAGQLDAAATARTVQTVQSAFTSSGVQSFESSSDAIDAALGSSAAVASAFVTPDAAGQRGRIREFGVRQLAQLAAAAAAPGTNEAVAPVAFAIPTPALGRTFEWSSSRGRYAVSSTPPSELPAVPSNGVRFLLYTWDDANDRPASPLTRVGYADIIESTTAQGRSYRLVVTANSTVFLDYTTSYTFSQAQQRLAFSVNGFVTNGTTRANFTLANTISAASNGSVVLDYLVTVPSENITLDYVVALRNVSEPLGDETLQIDLSLQGNGGRVDVNGTLNIAVGTVPDSDDSFSGFVGVLTVRVNNGTFATMTLSATGEPVIRNAAGQALSPAEADALEDVFDLVEDGFDFIEDLLRPVDQFFD